LKFVTQKQEQINTLQQQQTDESIITETEEAIEEAAQTCFITFIIISTLFSIYKKCVT
jgi:hypothetical protein